jgi:hypothetical protein
LQCNDLARRQGWIRAVFVELHANTKRAYGLCGRDRQDTQTIACFGENIGDLEVPLAYLGLEWRRNLSQLLGGNRSGSLPIKGQGKVVAISYFLLWFFFVGLWGWGALGQLGEYACGGLCIHQQRLDKRKRQHQ